MKDIEGILPLVTPLIIIEVGLALLTIRDILKHNNYKNGNRFLWICLSFVTIIGPICYFLLGRGES